MKKSEQKQIAKDILLEALACAYYKLEEHDEIPEEEKDEIIEYINKYGQPGARLELRADMVEFSGANPNATAQADEPEAAELPFEE